MKLLALETSTPVCSVAAWIDGAVVERTDIGRHSERILEMVQEALGEAGIALLQVDAIAFGRGPGSFTGLRIGAGVAQGLAFGAERPVVPVSSLAALAQGVAAPRVLAALDARMSEIYWGAYVRNAQGLVEPRGPERVAAPAQVPVPVDGGWVGAGSGWDEHHEALCARLGERLAQWRQGAYPHARCVAELAVRDFASGGALPPSQALPVYLRDDVAMKRRTPAS